MEVDTADEVLSAKLRKRGLRITPQRLVIHRALTARDQHLTAEQLLESVSTALPGTALPTVYATLELLEELGLTRRVSTGAGAVLFDSRMGPHAHAVCRDCGAVVDVDGAPPPPRALDSARDAGFTADYAQVVIWGACPACRAAA